MGGPGTLSVSAGPAQLCIVVHSYAVVHCCSQLLTDVRYSSYTMAVGDRLLMVGLLGAYLVSLCSYYKGGWTRILIAHSYYLWGDSLRMGKCSQKGGAIVGAGLVPALSPYPYVGGTPAGQARGSAPTIAPLF